MKNGYGKNTWPDGTVYDGECKDNIKNGQGKCTYPSGEVYGGEWMDDKMNGKGSYTYLSVEEEDSQVINVLHMRTHQTKYVVDSQYTPAVSEATQREPCILSR